MAFHIPLKTVLLSAYFDALSQFLHQNRITVSIVTSMRTERLPQTMDSLGLYWKLLPLSFEVRDNKEEQIAELQKSSNEMLEHLYYPLTRLYPTEYLDKVFYASFNYTNFYNLDDKSGISVKLRRVLDPFSSPIQLTISMQGNAAKVIVSMNEESFSEADLLSFIDLFKAGIALENSLLR